MRFATTAFLVEGLMVLITLIPGYLLEARIRNRLLPIMHPNYFCGIRSLQYYLLKAPTIGVRSWIVRRGFISHIEHA
jgi:hypothetical protein